MSPGIFLDISHVSISRERTPRSSQREIWYFFQCQCSKLSWVKFFEDLEYIIWCFQFVFFLPVIKLHIFHIFIDYLYLLFYEMSVKPRCQQTFSVNSQILSLLGFVGHAVFVKTIQLCYCNVKVAIGNV